MLPAWNPAAVFCALLFRERKINPGATGEGAPVCPSAFIKDLKAEASVFLPVEGRSKTKVPSSSGNSESQLTGSTIKAGGGSLMKGGLTALTLPAWQAQGSWPAGFQGLLSYPRAG